MFWCFDGGATPPPYRRCTPFAPSVLKVLQNGSLSHSSPIPNRPACADREVKKN